MSDLEYLCTVPVQHRPERYLRFGAYPIPGGRQDRWRGVCSPDGRVEIDSYTEPEEAIDTVVFHVAAGESKATQDELAAALRESAWAAGWAKGPEIRDGAFPGGPLVLRSNAA